MGINSQFTTSAKGATPNFKRDHGDRKGPVPNSQ